MTSGGINVALLDMIRCYKQSKPGPLISLASCPMVWSFLQMFNTMTPPAHEVLVRTNVYSCLILNFQPLKLWANKHFIFMNYPGSDILLQQQRINEYQCLAAQNPGHEGEHQGCAMTNATNGSNHWFLRFSFLQFPIPHWFYFPSYDLCPLRAFHLLL